LVEVAMGGREEQGQSRRGIAFESRVMNVALCLIIALSGCRVGASASTHEFRVASILSAEFETVVFARAQLLSQTHVPDGVTRESSDTLLLPFGYLLGALAKLGTQAAPEILAASESVLMGAKDFRPPNGLGAVRSTRCYVLNLRPGREIDLRRFIRTNPVALAAGASILKWEVDLGEFGEDDQRRSTLFAATLLSSYLLVCNGLDELRIVAERLTPGTGTSDKAEAVPGWDFVKSHDEWGVRRYRHGKTAHPMAAGSEDIGPSVDAMMFGVNWEERAVVLRMTGSAAGDDTFERINARNVLPPLKPTLRGTWDSKFQLAGNEKARDQAFVLVGLFGFAIFL
jgi:hypothetical protein